MSMASDTTGTRAMMSVAGRREEAAEVLATVENMAEYISRCAGWDIQVPTLAFPASEDGSGPFETFTAKQINQLADKAASRLVKHGLPRLNDEEQTTVGLLGQSSAQYVATLLALTKLGYTVFLMSPRMAASTVSSLLVSTDCNIVIYTENLESKVKAIQEKRNLTKFPLSDRQDLESDGITLQPTTYGSNSRPLASKQSDNGKLAYIWHSSGSTGVPKTFNITHKSMISRLTNSFRSPYWGRSVFVTSSAYNSAGCTFALLALSNFELTYFYNDYQPYTNLGLIQVLRNSCPDTVGLVPYAIEQLAESLEGVDALRNCRSVNAFGAVCPTKLGNALVEQGVKLNSSYAMSEVGTIMSSAFRDSAKDKAWDYMEPYPYIKNHIYMQPFSGSNDLYECVILPGLANCPFTNSDNPPGSFQTGDVFVAHPTIPNRWKLISRKDDVINMAFSESFVALPFEDHLRTHPLVDAAAVFGNGRPRLGVIIFGSKAAEGMSSQDVLDAIWALVEEMNAEANVRTRVAKDMAIVVPFGQTWPRTDKCNMIRPQVYHQYGAAIDRKYEN